MPKDVVAIVRTFDAELKFTINSNTTTHDLLEFVSKTVGVTEIALFGLRYKDRKGFLTWMRLNKKVLAHDVDKQNAIVLHFAVRFFPENVEKEMRTQEALQLLFLQVQGAMLSEEITCPPDKAALLASYTCQAAMGDFTDGKPKLRGEKLLPKSMTSNQDAIVPVICKLWQRHQGMDRRTAMTEYLKCAERLDQYGVNYYKVRGNKRGSEVLVGIHSSGMYVNEKSEKGGEEVKHRVSWSEVRKVDVRDKKLTIKLSNNKADNSKRPSVSLQGDSRRKIKHIYGLCLGNHELFCRRRLGRCDGRVIGKSLSEVMEAEELVDVPHDVLSRPPRDGEEPKHSLSDDEGEENSSPRPISVVSEKSDSGSSIEENKLTEEDRRFSESSLKTVESPQVDGKRPVVDDGDYEQVELKKIKAETEETQVESVPEQAPELNEPLEGYLLMEVNQELAKREEEEPDQPENMDVLSKVKVFDELFQPAEASKPEDLPQDKKEEDDHVDEIMVAAEHQAVVESEVDDLFDRLDSEAASEPVVTVVKDEDVEAERELEEVNEVVEAEEHEEEEEEEEEEDEEEDEEAQGPCGRRKFKDKHDVQVKKAIQRFNKNAGEPNEEQLQYEQSLRAESPSFFGQFIAKAKKSIEDFFSFGSSPEKKENDEKKGRSGDEVDESCEKAEYVPDVESEREDYFDLIDQGEDPDAKYSWTKGDAEEKEEPVVQVAAAAEVEAEVNDSFFDDLDEEEERIFAQMEAKKQREAEERQKEAEERQKEAEEKEREAPVVEDDIVEAVHADVNVESDNTALFNGFEDDKLEPETKGKDAYQDDFEKHRHNLEIMERMSNFEFEVKKAMEAIERCEDIVRRVEELQKKTDEKMTSLTYL